MVMRFVPFQVTFSFRSAWQFFRWNAVNGYLRDLDADGSLYSTCPARLVRWRGYSPPVRTSSVRW